MTRLVGHKSWQHTYGISSEVGCKFESSSLGADDWHGYSYHCCVRATLAYTVEHRVNLSPILTCHATASSLIPVDHYALIRSAFNYVPVGLKRGASIGRCNRYFSRIIQNPTGTRQAIQRAVICSPVTLSPVITNVKIRELPSIGLIITQKVIARSQHRHRVAVNYMVATSLMPRPDLLRKCV